MVKIPYIVPTLIPSAPSFNLDEVDAIVEYIDRRYGGVRAIAPFYYPLYLFEIGNEKFLVIDPFSSKAYKFEYVIPDISSLLDRVDKIWSRQRDFIEELKLFAKNLDEHLDKTKWLYRGIVLEKLIVDYRLLHELENVLNYTYLGELDGIVLEPPDIGGTIYNVKQAMYRVLQDLTTTQIGLQLLLEKLYSVRNTWASLISIEKTRALNELRRGFNRVRREIDQRLYRLNEKYEKELKNILDNYKASVNELRHRLESVEREIEKINSKLRHEERDRRRYVELLRELHKRRAWLKKELRRLEKSHDSIRSEVIRKYRVLQNIESMRRVFLIKEEKRFIREYEALLNRVDYVLRRIENNIYKINHVIERYRDSISKLLVSPITSLNGYIYLRGYVALCSKGVRIITTLMVRQGFRHGFKFESFSAIENLVKKKPVVKARIQNIDPRLVYKYNCMKRE